MDNGAKYYLSYLDGDNSGLDKLVELYNHNLIFYINGFVGNIAAAEDIAADTFVELIVKKYRFKNDYTFKTWLFKIARNNAIDHLRKQSKWAENSPIEDFETELADNEMLVTTLLKEEQNKQLHNAMKQMHSDYRDVLHLVCFENLSYDEAATVMKKSGKQIKNLVYRAKQALKLELERKGFIYEN
jgi:RNA polymerase sigma-70 factor (ECF subfamily)